MLSIDVAALRKHHGSLTAVALSLVSAACISVTVVHILSPKLIIVSATVNVVNIGGD